MESVRTGRNIDETVLQQVDPRGGSRRQNLITVKDILQLFLLGCSNKNIKRLYPAIDDKSIKTCRAFLKSKFPETFADLEGPAGGDLRILLDENIPLSLTPDFHQFGEAHSVIMHGWAGKKDSALYVYATGNRYDWIITQDKARIESRKDRDLCNVALDFRAKSLNQLDLLGKKISDPKKRPKLLILDGVHPYRDGSIDTLRAHKAEFLRLSHDTDVVMVYLRPEGLVPVYSPSIGAEWFAAVTAKRTKRYLHRDAADTISYAQDIARVRKASLSAKILDAVRDGVETSPLPSDAALDDVLKCISEVAQDVLAEDDSDEQFALQVFEAAMKSMRIQYLRNNGETRLRQGLEKLSAVVRGAKSIPVERLPSPDPAA